MLLSYKNNKNMFNKYFEKLKEHSSEKKRKIANLFAGFVTLLIVILWLTISFFVKPLKKKEKKPLLGGNFESFIQKMTDLKNPLTQSNQ